jgi:ABC-type branched-subunit amino acid transport system substrate-binding protein
MQARSAVIAVLCLFLVAIGSVVCDVSSGTITLGISLTTSPIGSSRALQGVKILNGLNFWLDKIAATSKEIRGQTYRFELKVLEDDGTASMTLENYRSLMNDTTVDYLLGPVGSETSNPVANLTESYQRLLIGTAVSSTSFYLNKEYAFSVVTASTRCPTVAFPYYRLRHAPRLALLISEATSPKEACEGMTSREAGANGLEIVASYSINSSLGSISEFAREQIRTAVEELKEKDVDTVVGCAFGDTGQLIMEEFKLQEYAPHFVTFLPFNNLYNETKDINEFITGCSRFEATANFVNDPIFGGTQQYVREYVAKYGSTPDDYVAFGSMAGMLLQLSIESAVSFSQEDVRNAVERFNRDTFMGQFFYGVDHSNQLSCLFVQIVNGTHKVIGPPLAQIESFDVVDPFPGWNERQFLDNFNSYTAEWVFFSLAVLGILLSLGLLIYVAVSRESPIIKASSPNLLIVFLIGSMFIYASIITWGLSAVSAATCYLQSWLLSFGWTIMFGALFAKSWRIYKLSSNTSLQIFKITDTQLVLIILGLLVGNIIICAVQVGVIDMTPIRVIVDAYRPVNDYEECPTSNNVGIAGALIAYNGVLGIGGLIIAWKIRKLRYSLYNESKIIAFSMYNAAFFAILISVLQFTKATDRELLYALRSAGIMLGTCISVLTLFISKLTMDRKKHSSSFKSAATFSSSGSYPKNNTSYASADPQRAVELQTRLKAKEEEIDALKKADGGYYQNKYESLYHENQLLKNELFSLRNFMERGTNAPLSVTPGVYKKVSESSSNNSTSSTDEKNVKN